MSRPLVSVIIPSFRALDCLRISLPQYLKCPGLEVIIGLDGYSEAYLNYLAPLPVKIVLLRRRQGAGTATNSAAAQAQGEYLFLANDDMVPAPGWLESLMALAGARAIVSGTCWEPGALPAPPPHRLADFGRDPGSFRMEEFFAAAAAKRREGAEPGINYPFLIPRRMWRLVGGLDPRFEPGSASDPDLFIRLSRLEPSPEMVRSQGAIFYHFASRSSIYAGGRLSLTWKLHRHHGRAMFRHKWGRMWEHRFGEVPNPEAWRGIVPRPEPALGGRMWRKIWFGNPTPARIVERLTLRAARSAPSPVAIFIWGGLGNLVMALPLVNAAREKLGDENLWLVLPQPGWVCLVHHWGRLRGVYTYDQMWGQTPRAEITIASLPYPRWRYGLLARYTRARVRIGDLDLANPLLCRLVDTRRQGEHWVERNLGLLPGLGIKADQVKFEIPIGDEELAAAEKLLQGWGLASDDNLIGLHPGAGNPRRRWPEERYIELGRILTLMGKKILVFGGPGEQELAARVAQGIGRGAVVFWGNLPQALALLTRCRALVGVDSGLVHCAAALGVSVLAIMGPSQPQAYRPYGRRVVVATGRSGCHPCYRPGQKIACRHPKRICLDIEAREIFQKLQLLM